MGRLSSSALSTATASMAFELAARAGGEAERAGRYAALAARARAWLARHANRDGGFGDTTGSPSNLSTTTLSWVALGLATENAACARAAADAEAWLARACGGTWTPEGLAAAIEKRYGADRTFSVPILMTCAIGGRLGPEREAWRRVRALPFEVAALSHRWFALAGLPMVSYALPALIAIGQARHFHRPSRNPVARGLRRLARRKTLAVLEAIQPGSGGYLEAAPLTSFVAMALLSMGRGEHPVVRRALQFLEDTVRSDGSWPIDTNLDTWLTSLSVGALAGGGGAAAMEAAGLDGRKRARTRAWLLDQQYRVEHPYTHAAPGGWAWTDLSGGVPDADDTPAALLALRALYDADPDAEPERVREAVAAGVRWLLDLQNRDGGIPTFCRGWGKLPFDRSTPELTAHALRAWEAWRTGVPVELAARIEQARARAIRFLLRTQRTDGAWVPLWFGNQHAPREENPLYGTARVLRAFAAVRAGEPALETRWRRAGCAAMQWLLDAQAEDGGFGAVPCGTPSIEETALAVEALADPRLGGLPGAGEALERAVRQGAAWLAERTEGGTRFPAAPIGLYFARLWYSEELYPVIFTTAALGRAVRFLHDPADRGGG